MQEGDAGRVSFFKERLASEQFVKHCSEAVDIAFSSERCRRQERLGGNIVKNSRQHFAPRFASYDTKATGASLDHRIKALARR